MNRKYVTVALLVIAILAGAVLALNMPALQKSKEPQKVTLLLDWIPNGSHSAFFYALDKGYYAEQGIALQIIRGQGSAFAATQVDQGKVEFGSVEFSTLIVNIAKGVKVKSFMIWEDRSPVGIATWTKFGIKTPKDLEERSFGASPFTATRFLLPVVMKLNGADMSKVKVELVDPGAIYASFLQGKFDTVSMYYDSGWPQTLRQANAQGLCCLEIHRFADWGADIYGFGVVGRPDFLEKNPDLARAFVAATARGALGASADPEEAVRSILKFEPALNKDDTLAQYRNSLEFMVKNPKDYGHATEKKLQTTISIIAEGYNIQRLNPDQVHSNAYLPRD